MYNNKISEILDIKFRRDILALYIIDYIKEKQIHWSGLEWLINNKLTLQVFKYLHLFSIMVLGFSQNILHLNK